MHTHTYPPGLCNISSNNNLSDSRWRSFEYLRGFEKLENIPVFDIKKNNENKQHNKMLDTNCQINRTENTDLRLINSRHEGVQRDDNKMI